MFKQNSKYRLIYLCFVTLVFAAGTIYYLYQFGVQKKGMEIIGGVGFGIMAIFKIAELIEFIKNKKALKQGHE
jgi:small neutral amino acid transporter SnatA (MarC family)